MEATRNAGALIRPARQVELGNNIDALTSRTEKSPSLETVLHPISPVEFL
jgi:hypothetical protein